MSLLDNAEILRALESLPGWTFQDGQIRRLYVFPSFSHAFAFMAGAATVAEKMNHHPEWTNVYNRVDVRLSTHDAGGVTRLDLDLAAQMESLASKLL
ncbi:MAG: 4a-hydroxytetrahydrobiopterin dehydratase [Bryobacteraceae bacterium]|jgi:4a-hydroxytetrahydrobiopterin dehydratase